MKLVNHRRIYVVLLVVLCKTGLSFAQNFAIYGTVQNGGDETTLPGATILLTHPEDSSFINGTVTDLNGEFRLTDLKPGKYLFRVQYLGFEPLTQALVLSRDLNMGILSLVEASAWLGEATVTEKWQMGLQKGDTTQFNAAAFKTLRDASAQSLVEKMPGISLQDGSIQAQGENVVQIMVDGKPFFGTDVKAALQNLPAEVIESVQIFDKKSDKAELTGFDDGETEKTINIVTKPDRRKGRFGKTSLGYGSRGRYLFGTGINVFNEDRRVTITGLSNNVNALNYSADPNSQGESRTQNGIIKTNIAGLNFSDDWGDKIEISGSYLFRQSENEDNASRIRNYILSSEEEQVYTERRNEVRKNMDHRFNLRFDYRIDENNRILIRPDISLKHDRENVDFLGSTALDQAPLNRTKNSLESTNYDYDFSNRLYYSRRFSKKGRSLTMRLNTGYHANDEEANRLAENNYYGDEEKEEILNQYTTLDRTGLSWEVDFSFTEPIGKKGRMELEYEIENDLNDSDKITYDVYEEANSPDFTLLMDTSLSNTFNSQYLSQKLEIGYRYSAEKLQLQLELQVRKAQLKNDQEFPALFDLERSFQVIAPTIRLDYKFSKHKKLEIDYDTRTRPPSINQLQDVINVSNPLHLRTGNPELNQSFSNRIRLRYKSTNPETDRSLFVYMQTSFDNRYITNSSTIAEEAIILEEGIVLEKGSQLSMPVNLKGYWSFRSYASYGKPVDLIKSNVSINGGVNYTRRPGMLNGVASFVDNSNFRLGLSASSNISDKIDFNFSTRSSYNMVENSLRPSANNNYFYQSTRLSYDWIIWKGLVYRLDLNHRLNTGLSEDFDNSFLFLNMSIGKKIFKNERGELSLNVYDLLGQNNNIRRNISEFYVEDVQSSVLQRYFMLSFSYNLRHFNRGTDMKDFRELHQ